MQPAKATKTKRNKKRKLQTMNPGEIRSTTTEINTEIKVEVKLETASITKVERSKSPSNQQQAALATNQTALKAIIMQDSKPGSEKSREEIKAEREAKKLAKQAKKTKTAAGDAAQIPAKKVEKVCTENVVNTAENDKSRDQIKAEREAKKMAKQLAKAAKSENIEGVAEKLAEIKINNTAEAKQSSLEEKVGI